MSNSLFIVIVFMFVLFLVAGYVLGVTSKWIFREGMVAFFKDEMHTLETELKTAENEVVAKCTAMVAEAQSKALAIYSQALQDTGKGKSSNIVSN